MEFLRDAGLEEAGLQQATRQEFMGENLFCTSLAGEEFARLKTWGNHPARRADYTLASPTELCDIPQNLMEPLLVGEAARLGAKVRFDTEYLDHRQTNDGVVSRCRDCVTGEEIEVRSRYLVGADGGNSKVARDAGLPFEGQMGVAGSMNIVFEADLTRFVAHRPSVLYWILQPGSDVGGLGMGIIRMVRPWHRWLAIWGYDLADGPPELTEESAARLLHQLIGDEEVDIRIESTSTWTVNDMHATRNTEGRVFIAGDAAHRHPPSNGLGSNTSIMDGWNLGWKIAMVLQGHAGEALLDSYDAERTPVARQVVKRANKSIGDYPPIFAAMGMLGAKDPEEMRRNMEERKDATPKAAARRAALREAIAVKSYEFNCHGVEMNQRYASGAVLADGQPMPAFERDAELYPPAHHLARRTPAPRLARARGRAGAGQHARPHGPRTLRPAHRHRRRALGRGRAPRRGGDDAADRRGNRRRGVRLRGHLRRLRADARDRGRGRAPRPPRPVRGLALEGPGGRPRGRAAPGADAHPQQDLLMASAAEGLGARPSLPTAALFVPGHRPERYAKAARSGAGAVIVDLEDAVPPEAKDAARAALVREGAALRGAALWVRVRPGLGDLGLDLQAAVEARSAAVMLPKASSPGVLALVAEELARLGSGAALVPLIETLSALPRLAALAAAPRVVALAFGPEDLAAEAGLRPEPAALAGPAQAVALAARAAGHGALGYPSTIGETRDLAGSAPT